MPNLNKIFQVTDANNTVFDINLESILFTSTDMDESTKVSYLEDEQKFLNSNFTPSIKDNTGVAITDEDKNAIIKSIKDGTSNIIALDVTYESTHSGDNKNYTVYHSDSMEKDAESWMYPYAKPFIKNHDIYEEPMGRVTDSNVGPSEFVEDRDTINVTFRLTDTDSIIKHLDSRYKTMSIGAKVGHVKCNVCGKDILKDGAFKWCGHMKGQKYGDKIATWSCRDLEYMEGSAVNAPADIFAQVKNMTIVRSETAKGGSSDSEEDPLTIIDNILGDGEEKPEANNDNSNIEPPVNSEPEGNEQTDPPVTDEVLIEENKKLKDKVSELEGTVEDLNGQVTDLNGQVETLNQTIETKDSDLARDKNIHIKLATINKNLIAERIADYESLSNKTLDKTARVKELVDSNTSKKLQEILDKAIEDFKKAPPIITKVTNPGLTDNDSEGNVTDEDKQKLTLKDVEEKLIKSLSK